MDENRYEKELFEFEKPKKRFPGLRGIFPGGRLEGSLSVPLTLEKILFLTIGVVMLMVVIYALGVERGKTIGKTQPVIVKVPAREMSQIRQIPGPAAAKPAVAVREIPPSAARPLTIVAASFRQRQGAEAEAGALKAAGLDAFVAESDPYHIVCVGTYATMEEARSALVRIKKVRRDAYIKMR